MKWLRDPLGRLPERPHYDAGEIDRECASRVASFLRQRLGDVRFPLSTNDLTILLEQETSDLDLYADLPPGVEGQTDFLAGMKPRVSIAGALSEDAAREHRLRTTLAHELGHVWLHAFLWAAPPVAARQSTSRALPALRRCGGSTILHARSTDWLEWQAGYASGAILMPRDALRADMERTQAVHAFRVTLDTAAGAALLTRVERAFHVSREAARVRLATSGLLPAPSRPSRVSGAPHQPSRPRPRLPGERRAAVLGTR